MEQAEIAIIGRGLIGAAAARHLARAGHSVVLIGPEEPAQRADHAGPFGSHYDEGRITRALDPDPFWSAASRASIARYGEIEAQGGISFFTEAGALVAGPEGSDFLTRVRAVAKADGLPHEAYGPDALAARFPAFRFLPGTAGCHEPVHAGHISPRRLVAAQTESARRAGALLLPHEALAIHEEAQGVRVETSGGPATCKRLLVAAGGYSSALLPEIAPVKVYARTVALFEVSEAQAAALAGMPSVVLLEPSGRDPYLLPPIRYPDGKLYLKLGGDPVDKPLRSQQEIGAWFRSGGDPEVGAYLRGWIERFMPGLEIASQRLDACMTSFSADGQPILRRLSDRVAVATAGCGKGAKCSDELGRLGAALVVG
ncbi:FAD-dependent oxidoreductase [Pseudoruegeria sp. SHC-113]|uniref:FAD-dependent oxidoreductase n=1 Tax=Pseudoruegeria sp. SHC-113 TaxID=2855439 RepID=UPI0021BB0BD9|nr:FAD-dependent oxidoreductase [Pseudoruegeria sp. SHC-113]MCT8161898.1 FAD-dependent oxidoreductase [Pseudoruegeria sp. SHC-113]